MNRRNPSTCTLTALTFILVAIGLSACQPKGVRPTLSTTPVPGEIDTTGAVRYQIDSAASKVHVLVYRGGAMARLGHNHVVSSADVRGTLLLHKDLPHSRVDLTLPVATLVVDDPQARATEGEEFAAEVPQEAREGTRRNLLRPEMLDGDRFPNITLQSIAVAGTRDNPSLIMRTTIKGVARDVVVLLTMREQHDSVTAEGEFTIQQTDFGIAPFSVALGALQVQDRLRIKFTLIATK